jgi:choline dehydrogenase
VNATVPWGNDPSENCTMKFDGTDPCFVQWNETGTGYYGEAAAPLSIRQRTRQSENEDIDIWMWGFAGFDIRGFYPGYSHPPPAPNTISMSMLRTQTPGDQAQGAVTLRSADPRDVPDIVFDWFQGEPGDRELTALTESAELLYRILAKSSGPQAPFTRVQPGEGVDIRQNMMDESFGHHASCSCRMGPVGSKDHCVDSQLRVNGVKGLRIVDGSVFPRVPGGFPQAPTYMMALRAADIISPN